MPAHELELRDLFNEDTSKEELLELVNEFRTTLTQEKKIHEKYRK